jgi:hypothetical protein
MDGQTFEVDELYLNAGGKAARLLDMRLQLLID